MSNYPTITVKRDRDEQGWPMWRVYTDELGFVGEVSADTREDAIAQAKLDLGHEGE